MIFSRLPIIGASLLYMLNNFAYAEDKQLYLGAKYGQYDFSLEGVSNSESAHGFAIAGSLELPKGMALEFEYGDSGSAEFEATNGTIKGGDLRLQHFGAYGVYRTPGQIYAKLKLGVSVNRLEAENLDCPYSLCTNTLSKDDGATVYGLGAGLTFFDNLRTELEYVAIDKDADVIQFGIFIGL